MRSSEKIVGVENVPREISYRVGHSSVTSASSLARYSKKHCRKREKIENLDFHLFKLWISRLKGRSRLTLEWPTLYDISRKTFSPSTIFSLGLIDCEIFAQKTDFGNIWRRHSAHSAGGGGEIFSMLFLTRRRDFFTEVPPLPPKCKVLCFYHLD